MIVLYLASLCFLCQLSFANLQSTCFLKFWTEVELGHKIEDKKPRLNNKPKSSMRSVCKLKLLLRRHRCLEEFIYYTKSSCLKGSCDAIDVLKCLFMVQKEIAQKTLAAP